MESKNKIESMVELRAFAIEKALEFSEINGNISLYQVMDVAEKLAEYIKGNAQLPEVKEENDKILYVHLIKMWDEKERERAKDFANIGPNFLVKDNS